MIPESAAAPIAAACSAGIADIEALVVAARSAGSLAIPLVKALTAAVAARDPAAAAYVHWGSTSQDVIDSACVLVTRPCARSRRARSQRLIAALHALARAHENTPILARTLLQPAQVVSFGFKIVAWVAPLVRARARLAQARAAALARAARRRRRHAGEPGRQGPGGRTTRRRAARRGSGRFLARAARRLGRARPARWRSCAARSPRSAPISPCSRRRRSASSPSRRARAAAALRRCRRRRTRSRR